MPLVRALSNPEELATLAQLHRLQADLRTQTHISSIRHKAVLKPRHGVIQAAVMTVLDQASGPLRAVEIHARVEQLLGQEVASTTVGSVLSIACRNVSSGVVRVRYGVYRRSDR